MTPLDGFVSGPRATMSEEDKAFQEGVEWAAKHFEGLSPCDPAFRDWKFYRMEAVQDFAGQDVGRHGLLWDEFLAGATSVAKLVGGERRILCGCGATSRIISCNKIAVARRFEGL